MSLDDPKPFDGPSLIAMAAHMHKDSTEFALERQEMLTAALSNAINKAAALDFDLTLAVLCSALDGLGAGTPIYTARQADRGQIAKAWADGASADDIAAFLPAILAAIPDKAMCLPDRKRIIVAIWNTLPPADRTAFLDFIEPGPAAKA